MIGFLFALALHSRSCKMEGHVNLRYVRVVYSGHTHLQLLNRVIHSNTEVQCLA